MPDEPASGQCSHRPPAPPSPASGKGSPRLCSPTVGGNTSWGGKEDSEGTPKERLSSLLRTGLPRTRHRCPDPPRWLNTALQQEAETSPHLWGERNQVCWHQGVNPTPSLRPRADTAQPNTSEGKAEGASPRLVRGQAPPVCLHPQHGAAGLTPHAAPFSLGPRAQPAAPMRPGCRNRHQRKTKKGSKVERDGREGSRGINQGEERLRVCGT